MQVRVVTQNSGSLHRIILVVLGKLLQRVEGLLIDQVPLLNPAFDAAGRSDPRKAFFVVQDLDPFAVFDVANAAINCRDLVPQRGLRRGHVGHLEDAVASVAAARKQQGGHSQRQRKAANAR